VRRKGSHGRDRHALRCKLPDFALIFFSSPPWQVSRPTKVSGLKRAVCRAVGDVRQRVSSSASSRPSEEWDVRALGAVAMAPF
jgi:hypothetical protein